MNLGKILPVGGFVIAVALVGITSGFKDAPKETSGKFAQSHFEFTGIHGLEDQRADWKLISEEEYDALACETGQQGCGMIADLDPSDNHPVEVYVNNTTSEIPVTGTHVSAVINKN